MTILTKSTRKVNRPTGFYDTPAPQPAPDLRLFLDDDRRIIKLHVKGEPAFRWHREVMTLDHPFMVKFLSGYNFIQEYRIAHIGLTIRAYRLSELPTPVSELAPDNDIIERFVSETAPESPTPVSELDGPRNWGESIMELLGQDYKANRSQVNRKITPPTNEEGERMLRAALGADWNQRHADRRAQFGRGR